MNGIKWKKVKYSRYGKRKCIVYEASLGDIQLSCRGGCGNEWCGNAYLGNEWLADSGFIRKSSELAKKDIERIALKYLLGSGFVLLEALKEMDLLEDMLSEVGVHL